ncbi:restriction endonuclease subunit S [Enterococcus avium]|uniref:restriction endonuclease subunit S n=1 Tax=Enterococcus TaxID=1350 RepID=UPI0010DCE494|nr:MULTISPECIES: restriction endonuclease subunit S [Enterococcus]NVN76494.1 restriction endonuclease subunit S [Enterococcus avium]QQU17243.1 restriction endonuclease subunit S [Enterococcus casseliflavus]VTS56860.1 type I site-specific deoxyribonuclease specificity subunit [Enterococcus casseliflavus]
MSKDKQPEIRFPGFTEDWEERKLDEIFGKIRNAFVGTATPYYVDEGHFYLESNNVKDGRINRNTEVFINDEFYEKQKDKWLHTNDIVMVQSGHVGHTAVIPEDLDKTAAHALIMFSNYKTKTSPFFLNYQFQTLTAKRKLENITTGNTIKHILASEMKKFEVTIPEHVEQQKIGSFFKQLDDTIALHQRKLDLLKETKKGFLQKMFPKNGAKVPEIRFPGFTEDWEERKFGETKTYFTDGNYGESYPSSKDMSDKENGVPFLRGSDFSNGYLDSSNANYIKYEKHQELTSGHIKQDDIVIAVRGSLGTLGYANKENEGWNINSQLAILRTNKSEILGMFLIQYLLSNKGQKEILSRNTGTALKQLPIKQLKDIPIPMPAISEQQKIGTFFKQLDDTITLHQRKLDLLKETKKGFLQKMFV